MLSDVGVGAGLAGCALKSALLNVYINTRSMKNREIAEKLNTQAKKTGG